MTAVGTTGNVPASGGLAFGKTGAVPIEASVVDLRHLDPDAPITVDIATVRGTQGAAVRSPSQLRSHPDLPGGADVSENRRTTVLLDALEVGPNDWEAGFQYLEDAMRRFPDDPVIRDTYQFLLGMTSVGEVIDYPGREERHDRDLLHRTVSEPSGPLEGIDYESWSLVRRAQRAGETERARDLWRKAWERNQDNRMLRDIYHFVDGVVTIRNSDFADGTSKQTSKLKNRRTRYAKHTSQSDSD